jgi:hypothetical protein
MSATRVTEGSEPEGRGDRADGGDYADFAGLDDTALISLRWHVREQLEREPANMADLVRAHHLMTLEVLRRTKALRNRGG